MRSSRRRQIMDRAAALFAERGFHGVTVDEIGAQLGVSGPALYHHFAGKEELLGEVLEAISDELLAGGRDRIARATTADEALTELVAFQVDFALDRPALITVHFRDLVHAPPASQERIRRTQAAYVELWVDVLVTRSPGLERRTARATAFAAIGLINSTPYSRRLGRAAMRDLLARMAIAALDAATAP